jgi:transcriptional regulator with XRE-family HTH domain
MPTRDRVLHRADRAADRWIVDVGRGLHEARTAAGISQSDVGDAVGLSHTQVHRIERAKCPEVPARTLIRLACAVGMDLPLRLYPAGDPVRDAAHAALLERFRSRIHPSLAWRLEVPLGMPGDRRAWDAVVAGPTWRIGAEAEMRLGDVQATLRRFGLKRRDGAVDLAVLLVADTRHNRLVLRAFDGQLGDDLAVDGDEILANLSEARRPTGGGVVRL